MSQSRLPLLLLGPAQKLDSEQGDKARRHVISLASSSQS